MAARLDALAGDAAAAGDLLAAARSALEERLAAGDLSPAALDAANRTLRDADRAWTSTAGLTGRPWYRNLYAAPDADSGYAPWLLPELTRAAEAADPGELGRAGGRYREVVRHLDRLAGDLAAAAGALPIDPEEAARGRHYRSTRGGRAAAGTTDQPGGGRAAAGSADQP